MKRGTRKQWAERVECWQRSGQTAREFAAREGVRASTLSWWKGELRRAARASARFIEVERPSPSEAGQIEIVVREHLRIRVSGAFDAGLLRRVVAALEAA